MTGIEPTTNVIIKITEDRKTDQNYIYKKMVSLHIKSFLQINVWFLLIS